MAAICANSCAISLAKSSTMIIAWPPTSLMRPDSTSVFTVVPMEPDVFDVAGIDAHHAGDPVHHEAQRLADVDHQGAGRVVVLHVQESRRDGAG